MARFGIGMQGAYKWYVLAILVLIYAIGSVDLAVIAVIAEPLKQDFRLSDKQIGVLSGFAYSLTYALAVLPFGWLIDRRERRSLLSCTVAIWSVLTAVCAMSSSFVILLVTRLGVGAAEAPTTPGALSLIADLFPKERRATVVSLYFTGAAIGQIAVFVIGGWLLIHYSWRVVFLVAGGPGIFCAALLYFTTTEPRRGAFDEAPPASSEERESIRATAMHTAQAILRNVPLLYGIPAITIGGGVAYSVTVWATSFLVRLHHMTVSQGAIATGVGWGVWVAIGTLLVGPLADRFSRGDPHKQALIPAITTLIATIAGITMLLASSLIVTLAAMCLVALMTGFFYSTGYAITLSLARPAERGTTMAATKLISTLFGSGFVPFVTGAISDHVGGTGSIRTALLITIVFLLAATACWIKIYNLPGLKAENNSVYSTDIVPEHS
jgi:MFS family permease